MTRSIRRTIPVLMLLLASVAPSRARAAVGVGVHQWFGNGPLIEVHVGAERDLVDMVAIGLRGGVMYETNDSTFGVPLDAYLRAKFHPLYVEALGGPWLLFKNTLVRGHLAGGVGYQFGGASVGLEAGTLGGSGIVGLKLETGF